MRCPRCGNDAPKEEFICSFCGNRLKMEDIEKIKLFRRQEEKWTKADGALKRIVNVIRNPSRAFWDITHQSDATGPFLVILFNAITLGLWGWAAFVHLDIQLWQGVALNYNNYWIALIYGLSIFLVYFLFGFIYYSVLFYFFNLLFSIGANFSTNMNNLIEMRYKLNKDTKEKAPVDKSKKDVKDQLEPKKLGKNKVMFYAFSPFILTNLLSTIILLIGLPTVPISNTGAYGYNQMGALTAVMSPIFSSSVWGVIDFLQIITLAVWVPICMAIALRDLANTSTTKLLVGCIVMGILMSYMFYFLRPTLGWNLNIIQNYG